MTPNDFARFFTTFDESIWTDFPTVAALKNLYDNYKPAVTIEEDNTSAEQAETNAFLDAVMASDIMQETYRTLSEAKVVTGTIEDFRAQIWTLWFEGYDRDGTSANVVGSRSEFKILSAFAVSQFTTFFSTAVLSTSSWASPRAERFPDSTTGSTGTTRRLPATLITSASSPSSTSAA